MWQTMLEILHSICNNWENLTKLLIDAECDINIQNKYQKSPLFLALEAGLETCAQHLIDAGCRLDNENLDGSTLFHQASATGFIKFVELFEEQCKYKQAGCK